MEKLLTVPNALTALRGIGIPIFLYLVLSKRADGLAIVVLMIAGATDYFDGKLARAWNQTSRLGELMDPAIDRLYIAFFALLIPLPSGPRHCGQFWASDAPDRDWPWTSVGRARIPTANGSVKIPVSPNFATCLRFISHSLILIAEGFRVVCPHAQYFGRTIHSELFYLKLEMRTGDPPRASAREAALTLGRKASSRGRKPVGAALAGSIRPGVPTLELHPS